MENLERAARLLAARPEVSELRASPIYENAALLPLGAPADWDIPFFNAVLELNWSSGPLDLLRALKSIEQQVGREPNAPRWAPRVLDLDILLFGREKIVSPELTVPHAQMWDRSFVMTPLKDLAPSLRLPGRAQTVLQRARELGFVAPSWMGICNLTPDSFSDGGSLLGVKLTDRRQTWSSAQIAWMDLGAESTRPGAAAVDLEEEWRRLEPGLRSLAHERAIFASKISVDTYHGKTAERALELGADLINDVSGLADPRMLEVLQSSRCEYVLMHSLSVPADPSRTLTAEPVEELLDWAESRLERLTASGVRLERVIFDPGIGFGKTAEQSWKLLQSVEALQRLPVRLLIGHSRKSFLRGLGGERVASERDFESVGVSLRLAAQNVDILRVHEPLLHARAWKAFQSTGQRRGGSGKC